MDPLVIAALTVTAFFAGTVDAIAGGGGLITVPALLMTNLPTHVALGTNKGQSVWGSGAALITFWRAGAVDRKQALITFPLGFVGSVIGAEVVIQLIDKDSLRPIVIGMLIAAACLLVIRKPAAKTEQVRGYLTIAGALALVIGAYDGFFGPGTGTFLIVGFVALCGKPMTSATADAKVVNFASNLAALTAFAWEGSVEWKVALPMAGGQLLGGALGARLALKGGAKLIRIAVLVVSGALVIRLVIDLL